MGGKKRRIILVLLIATALVVVMLLRPRRPVMQDPLMGATLVEGLGLRGSADAEEQLLIRSVIAAAASASGPAELVIDYPSTGSVFPPEMVAPTFLWHDGSEEADRWVIDVTLAGGGLHLYALSQGPPRAAGPIDERCLGETNRVYQPTPDQASARAWMPDNELWDVLKLRSVGEPAVVTLYGFKARAPGRILSKGQMTLSTSRDPVGAPIFYRDVPLMPSPTRAGAIKPLAPEALPLIAWRLRDVSRQDSRVVLTDMPTCGNCHSFSADGKTLGMDIDGPSGDKGAYAIVPVSQDLVIEAKDLITWNSFPTSPKATRRSASCLGCLPPVSTS